jgi:hypothetical protein
MNNPSYKMAAHWNDKIMSSTRHHLTLIHSHPYSFSLSLFTGTIFKQCCGAGTGMRYGSGTGFGSGSNIKCTKKSQMRGQFLGNKLLSDNENARFCAIFCLSQNRNHIKSLSFHNTATKYVSAKIQYYKRK